MCDDDQMINVCMFTLSPPFTLPSFLIPLPTHKHMRANSSTIKATHGFTNKQRIYSNIASFHGKLLPHIKNTKQTGVTQLYSRFAWPLEFSQKDKHNKGNNIILYLDNMPGTRWVASPPFPGHCSAAHYLKLIQTLRRWAVTCGLSKSVVVVVVGDRSGIG